MADPRADAYLQALGLDPSAVRPVDPADFDRLLEMAAEMTGVPAGRRAVEALPSAMMRALGTGAQVGSLGEISGPGALISPQESSALSGAPLAAVDMAGLAAGGLGLAGKGLGMARAGLASTSGVGLSPVRESMRLAYETRRGLSSAGQGFLRSLKRKGYSPDELKQASDTWRKVEGHYGPMRRLETDEDALAWTAAFDEASSDATWGEASAALRKRGAEADAPEFWLTDEGKAFQQQRKAFEGKEALARHEKMASQDGQAYWTLKDAVENGTVQAHPEVGMRLHEMAEEQFTSEFTKYTSDMESAIKDMERLADDALKVGSGPDAQDVMDEVAIRFQYTSGPVEQMDARIRRRMETMGELDDFSDAIEGFTPQYRSLLPSSNDMIDTHTRLLEARQHALKAVDRAESRLEMGVLEGGASKVPDAP